VTGGPDLTVLFAVGGRELTVYRLDPATGDKRVTAEYMSSSPLVTLPGQADPLVDQ
jgi:hypothetical protein